jgi:hypothetical protein
VYEVVLLCSLADFTSRAWGGMLGNIQEILVNMTHQVSLMNEILHKVVKNRSKDDRFCVLEYV